MRLELKDIKGGVLEQESQCSVADFPELISIAGQDGPTFRDPLTIRLRFQLTGQIVELDGHIDAVVTLRCGRCLEFFEHSVSESFSLTFTPHLDGVENEEELELDAEELGLTVYHDEALDLRDPLQEQLIMAIPISPLCSNGCQGLCPECGVNHNKDRCDCTGRPFNNKFTALSGIDFKKA